MAEVKLSQESYDELLKDIKALRLQADTYFEQWQDAKKKAEAFDEILEITEEDCWAEDFAVYISQVIDKYKEVDYEG
nr:MAG TPA: Protein of unknown function (DUF1024) [Caudoviricetes sp.]